MTTVIPVTPTHHKRWFSASHIALVYERKKGKDGRKGWEIDCIHMTRWEKLVELSLNDFTIIPVAAAGSCVAHVSIAILPYI